MNSLWARLFWRTASRIIVAGFVLGGLYAPVFYTLILIPSVLFNASIRENFGAILGIYLLSVIAGAIFGCIFGMILGAIMGVIQGITTLVILRFFFFPPQDELQLKYSLTASSLVVSLIVGYLYLAKVLPGLSIFMSIILLIIAAMVNIWIVQKTGDWYLSEFALFLSSMDEFKRTDTSREP